MKIFVRSIATLSLTLIVSAAWAFEASPSRPIPENPPLFNTPGGIPTTPGFNGSANPIDSGTIFVPTGNPVGIPGINGNVGNPDGNNRVSTPVTGNPIINEVVTGPGGRGLLDPNLSGVTSTPGAPTEAQRRLAAISEEGISYTPAELAAIEDGLCSQDILDNMKRQQAATKLIHSTEATDRYTAKAQVGSASSLACTPLFQSRVANAAISLVTSAGFARKFFNFQVLDLSGLGSKLPIGGALVGSIGALVSQELSLLVGDITADLTGGLLGGGGNIDFSADDCTAMQELVQVSGCMMPGNPVMAFQAGGGRNQDINALCDMSVDARNFIRLF